jgi:pimeloyl-ACP methyl ester carboxylesterase
VALVARYARVNGWRTRYVDEGVGDPIVLLHGNPTGGFLYRSVIPPLINAGHRVTVPDMIGFGLSEKPAREHPTKEPLLGWPGPT